jgi:hypothetical protein
MYVQAGVGVVADSVPEDEYAESVQKARALFRAAEDAVRYASRDDAYSETRDEAYIETRDASRERQS